MPRKKHFARWSPQKDDTLRELAKDRNRSWTEITDILNAWAAVDFLRKTLDDLRQAGCLEDYNEILNELDSIRLTSPED